MQNLLKQLKKVLAKDTRLISEGELFKNKIIELGIKLDPGLLKLLLADKQMKEAFFAQVGEATVFEVKLSVSNISQQRGDLDQSFDGWDKSFGLVFSDLAQIKNDLKKSLGQLLESDFDLCSAKFLTI